MFWESYLSEIIDENEIKKCQSWSLTVWMCVWTEKKCPLVKKNYKIMPGNEKTIFKFKKKKKLSFTKINEMSF